MKIQYATLAVACGSMLAGTAQAASQTYDSGATFTSSPTFESVSTNGPIPASFTLVDFPFSISFPGPNGTGTGAVGASAVPEASTGAMLAFGLGALAFMRRRKGR